MISKNKILNIFENLLLSIYVTHIIMLKFLGRRWNDKYKKWKSINLVNYLVVIKINFDSYIFYDQYCKYQIFIKVKINNNINKFIIYLVNINIKFINYLLNKNS